MCFLEAESPTIRHLHGMQYAITRYKSVSKLRRQIQVIDDGSFEYVVEEDMSPLDDDVLRMEEAD